MLYNFNGKILDGKTIELSIQNRALNYGDGLFETMKFAHNRINFWEDHYFRLMSSMRILRMEIPMAFSPEFLEDEMRKTLQANDLEGKTARVKLLVFRMEGGFYTPENSGVDFLITVSELENPKYELNDEGLEIDLFKDYYKQASLLSNLKTTAATLYTVASIFKKENGFDECILLNDNKMVADCISSNLFLVKEKTVFTPPLSDGCLKGVMRKQVIGLLPKIGFEIKEESFSPFELQRADAVYLTNAIHGVQWVKKYRKKDFEKGLAEELVHKINLKAALG